MWERAFPGSVNQVRQVRSAVRIVLDGCPAADDVVQILSEIAANACQHSRSGKPGGKFTSGSSIHPVRVSWLRSRMTAAPGTAT
jgi:hypothetical protein